MSGHLDYCTAPLLGEDWGLDVDTMIKPLYGHQGELSSTTIRRSRVVESCLSQMLANVRLVLDVEVMSGNKHTSDNSVPGRFWFAYMHKVCVLIDAETQGSDSFELLKLASFRQLLNWLAKMR